MLPMGDKLEYVQIGRCLFMASWDLFKNLETAEKIIHEEVEHTFVLERKKLVKNIHNKRRNK